MGPFGSFVDFLNQYGVFTYLAYFLLLILLYYTFKYVLGKHAQRLQKAAYRQALAAVLALIVTVLLYFLLASFAGTAAAYLAAAVFIIVALFLIVVLVARMAGVDILPL